ncbi:MAG: hypothetical protein JNK05_36435 [Myxococcales bacterium]|nr:hypothetical protein [Myxococcales bacterium]
MFAGAPDAPPSIALGKGGWAERQADGTWVYRDYPVTNARDADPISADADSRDSAWVSVGAMGGVANGSALLRWTRLEGMRVVPLEGAWSIGAILANRPDDVLVGVVKITQTCDLRHWNGSAWTQRFELDHFGGVVRGMGIEPDGAVLVARFYPHYMAPAPSELVRCRGSSCVILREIRGVLGPESLQLAKDRSNAFWLRDPAGGLQLRRVGESDFMRVSTVATPTNSYPALLGSGLLALVRASASSSDNVIVSIDGATATPRPLATVPSMLRGSAIWAENERSLWFGTENGGILHWTSDSP